MDFEPVIGLEIHTQLKTKTKMFCRCEIVDYNSPANSSICPICSGQPGSLPLPNKKAIEMAIKIGVALNSKINNFSVFARKNYFYPDLPKGYQISQYENPICENGRIKISGKEIRIKRAHLEEDAGKSLHAIGSQKLDYSLIDFNRCGVPLVEIVTEPDISSADEAYEYLVELKKLLKWIDVSNCDMEKGELRCDVNISLRHKGDKNFGTKVEIKNLNSFKAVKDALNYEIKRQSELLSKGEKIEHETRLWDAVKQQTITMRSKEMACDYRYFPDPDLIPLNIPQNLIDDIKRNIGKLPCEIKEQYISEYKLKEDDIETITSNKYLNNYFSKILQLTKDIQILKNSLNIINTQLLAYINENKIEDNEIEFKTISPEYIYEIAELISKNEITSQGSKKLFEHSIKTKQSPKILLDSLGLKQTNDLKEIEKWVKDAIELNKKAFEDFKSGNDKATGPIIGYVMKQSRGKANPKIVIDILKKL
ncbi:MAG: Asp-tRNA(Asn)/Glu-tRNA(Gln) amidotransferase subunit GatB [Elusimicrobiota bacterium]